MAKRLVRTKNKIQVAGIPYRVPPAHLLPERTGAVLHTIYLMFHQGYVDGRGDLAGHARHLAAVTAALMPDDPEAAGLYALLLLLDARRDARIVDGVLVPLDEQDRTRWDRALIGAGLVTVRRALRREQPGPYQLQALIAACHVQPETDWTQIVRLYDELVKLVPSGTVRLNRAIAVAMRDGPQAGLDLLPTAGDHPLLAATRADLLRRAGRRDEAAGHYRAALAGAESDAERRYLERRAREATQPEMTQLEMRQPGTTEHRP
jgi:RNA polymerase sigma-70 factor (ECF subfamily)